MPGCGNTQMSDVRFVCTYECIDKAAAECSHADLDFVKTPESYACYYPQVSLHTWRCRQRTSKRKCVPGLSAATAHGVGFLSIAQLLRRCNDAQLSSRCNNTQPSKLLQAICHNTTKQFTKLSTSVLRVHCMYTASSASICRSP